MLVPIASKKSQYRQLQVLSKAIVEVGESNHIITKFITHYKMTLENFAQNDGEEFNAAYVMHQFIHFTNNQIRKHKINQEIAEMVGDT
jgi:hypothetical protein